MTNKIIKERIDLLELNYRTYLLSNDLSNMAQDFATKHKFDEDTAIVFENGIAMMLMFFIDKQDFVDYLVTECKINNKYDASVLAEAIILSLPENIRSSYETTRNQIFETTTKVEEYTHKPNEPISIDKEIKEAEEVLSSINHVRTMSSDKEATKETVHVSSQFDLFGRKDKKGNDSEETRWGTDK